MLGALIRFHVGGRRFAFAVQHGGERFELRYAVGRIAAGGRERQRFARHFALCARRQRDDAGDVGRGGVGQVEKKIGGRISIVTATAVERCGLLVGGEPLNGASMLLALSAAVCCRRNGGSATKIGRPQTKTCSRPRRTFGRRRRR